MIRQQPQQPGWRVITCAMCGARVTHFVGKRRRQFQIPARARQGAVLDHVVGQREQRGAGQLRPEIGVVVKGRQMRRVFCREVETGQRRPEQRAHVLAVRIAFGCH